MRKFILIFLLVGCAAVSSNAQNSGDGTGSGRGSGNGMGANEDAKNTFVRIISKPRAAYTDNAREKNIQGTVTLRVEFKEDSTIGKVSVVSGLPEGLSEQAVKAAGLMRFEPQKSDGKPITVTKNITYNFTLY